MSESQVKLRAQVTYSVEYHVFPSDYDGVNSLSEIAAEEETSIRDREFDISTLPESVIESVSVQVSADANL